MHYRWGERKPPTCLFESIVKFIDFDEELRITDLRIRRRRLAADFHQAIVCLDPTSKPRVKVAPKAFSAEFAHRAIDHKHVSYVVSLQTIDCFLLVTLAHQTRN